mmetsp:Transcript_80589/g.174194  ORF Transcript_80589/g.174194 Transcript_80589/m.174194 type:complete len:247 (+) Transcript_80589:74-814(+)
MAPLIPRTLTDSPPFLVVRRNGGTCWSVTVVTMCDRRPCSSSCRKTQSLRLPVKVHHLGGQELSAFQLNVSSGITSTLILPLCRAQSVSQMGRSSRKLALMLSCVKNTSLGRTRRQLGLPSTGAPGLAELACPAAPACGLGFARCATVDQPGALASAAYSLRLSAGCSLSVPPSAAGSAPGARRALPAAAATSSASPSSPPDDVDDPSLAMTSPAGAPQGSRAPCPPLCNPASLPSAPSPARDRDG